MLSLYSTFNPVYYSQNIELNIEILEPLLLNKLSPMPNPTPGLDTSGMIPVRIKSKIQEFKNRWLTSSSIKDHEDESSDHSCPICLESYGPEIFICSECAMITHTECIITAAVNKASCPHCRSEKFKSGFYFSDIRNQELTDAIPITREIWFRYPSVKLPSKEENLFDAKKRFKERNLLLTCKVMNSGYFYSEFSIIGDQFHATARTNNQRVSRLMRDFTNSLNENSMRGGERMGWFEYEQTC